MYIGLHVKNPFFFSDCKKKKNLNFLDLFSKNIEISNFMKIRPAKAQLFHSDGQRERERDKWTHMTKLIVAFRNFTRAPVNVLNVY